MFLHTIPVGELRVNCYIIADPKTSKAMVIDPGAQIGHILPIIQNNGFDVQYIVNTHAHYDHVGVNGPLQEITGAPIYMHSLEFPILEIMRGWGHVDSPIPDETIDEGDLFQVGSMEFKVMHTPGHSPGGVSLCGEGLVFTGDTLFYGCVGRYDLPGSSKADLKKSLEKLMKLPDKTIVYPGHDVTTTIGAERRTSV